MVTYPAEDGAKRVVVPRHHHDLDGIERLTHGASRYDVDALSIITSIPRSCFRPKSRNFTLLEASYIDQRTQLAVVVCGWEAGDLVLSRNEYDPEGLVVAQTVEEVFVREGLV